MFIKFYNNFILKFPKIVLSIFLILTVTFGFYATKLEIDASAETLLLDGDKDLELTRKLSKDYASSEFLVITFKPKYDLLDEKTLNTIKDLTANLYTLKKTESVTSILNVPLLQSPVQPISKLLEHIPTLYDENINKRLVKEELLSSVLYSKNLVSEDFKTTAILVNLKKDPSYKSLQNAQESKKQYRDRIREENHQNIVQLREILQDYKEHGQLHLGGINMIADDMIEFVKYDLSTFGYVVFAILVFVLFILFRKLRWVIVPLIISFSSIVITAGLLALFKWEITIISSNFISLQLIMNMSLIIHLTIKYKELLELNPQKNQKELLINTVSSMIKPSFFVVITTIAGFSSLVFSNILPVINFGWMMSMGIVISLLLTFILFPTILLLIGKEQVSKNKLQDILITSKVGIVAKNYKKTIIVMSLLIVCFSISGATKLVVENSFIDYFKKDTEIYKGMKVLDQELGGTTPLDVLLTFKNDKVDIKVEQVIENDFMDEFASEFITKEEPKYKEQYWFTPIKMETIKKVHEYLDSLEATGKVLSLHTVASLGKTLNNNQDLDSMTLALLYKELPIEYKQILIDPYLNIEKNQVRFSMRVIDSQENLRRNELLQKINNDLTSMLDPKFETFKVTNLVVIYNNLLQSLFDSQIKTIGIVVLILFIMFLVLFKNLKLAIIAIIANTAPVSVIFGFMGWMEIPLDMMTITIAAISIGIAVDDTIHYIHRFKEEHKLHQDYNLCLTNSHKTIGRAMFYTSLIIMIGFSVLVLSNFIPTIYFGLLTLLAMFMAIAADLLLLPALLLLIKPFKSN